MIIALLLCGAAPALAQTTPSTPQHEPLKTIRGSDTLHALRLPNGNA